MTRRGRTRYQRGVTPRYAHMPVALEPAPTWLLGALYVLALVPVLGVVLVKLFEMVLCRSMSAQGRHMGSMHLASHAKGALIIGAVWSVAFVARQALLDAILLIAG
jgi:hypothetical protein